MKHLLSTIFILMFTAFSLAQEQTTIAVLQLDYADISEQEAVILTKKLSSELVKLGTYTVLDRSEMSTILTEQGFQQSGCTSSECAVEVGQLLGVQKMVAGSVGKIGSIYYTEIRLLDVTTSQIEKTVDHSQSGSIEDVLLKSMPLVAANLSDTEPLVDIAKISEPVVEKIDTATIEPKESVVEPTVETVPIPVREITLISHHRNARILLNDSIIGRNKVTITVPSDPVKLAEQTRAYTSKTETVNLTDIEANHIGVGGKRKESYISFAYSGVATNDRKLPAGKISVGSIRQSSTANGLTLWIGSLNGFGTFTDIPDTTYLNDTVTVTIGGMYEWRKEWDFARIIKWGVGFDVGFLYCSDQHLQIQQIGTSVFSPVIAPVRTDIYTLQYGGTQFKFAVGYKKVFLETTIHTYFGTEIREHYADFGNNEWENLDTDGFSDGSEFVVNSHIGIGLLLVL